MRIALLLIFVACTQGPPKSLATGELGTWQPVAALPTPRANHCSSAIEDWVLVIGGNHMAGGSFVKTAEIHAARIADGVLGPWQLAGTLPSGVTECSATSNGRTLYVLDGLYDDASHGRQVWSAALDDTGQLGALASLGALPDTVVSSEATVHEATLLLMDTRLPMNGNATVALRSPIAGALAWSVEELGIDFRAQAQYAFTADHVFTLGGYHDPAQGAVADVFVAPIAGGTASATTALPTAVGFGEAIGVDDWLFVAGGRATVFGAPGTAQVFAAQVGADGSLGGWRETALPMGRTNHELTLAG
ncbi:MAG TPA: kelch repeat-containing protein, partial [Kofleriaceae bacterium]